MATTKVTVSGPIFSGAAQAAARDFTDSLAGELAEVAKTWIQVEAQGYDRSGRGGTGALAAGVEGPFGSNGAYTIRGGLREGRYSWPWIEGESKRNQSTGFGGYHTFRRTRQRMRKQVAPLTELRMEEFLERMGGSET